MTNDTPTPRTIAKMFLNGTGTTQWVVDADEYDSLERETIELKAQLAALKLKYEPCNECVYRDTTHYPCFDYKGGPCKAFKQKG